MQRTATLHGNKLIMFGHRHFSCILRFPTIVAVAILTLLPLAAEGQSRLSQATGQQGMVVTVSPPATRVGLEILRQGGNAVDAAIAVEFALAVTWPEAGNIGGGGFMMVHPGPSHPGRKVVCIDYREVAPRRSTETMFRPDDGRHTHKIVGVPGTVHGMVTAHRRHGSAKWKRLLAPSILLARDGFEVDAALARSINRVLGYRSVREGPHHQELVRVYGKPDGTQWQEGDRLVLPDLARTLKRIADKKDDGFYDGRVAKLIEAEMLRGGGLVNRRDLDDYRARVRPAVHGTFRGHDVYGAPPPSSGGTCVVQMLNVLEQLDLRAHPRYSARNLHLVAETMKRAFCDRARHLGDADFVDIPGHLVTKDYAKTLAAGISIDKATPSEQLAPEIRIADESPQTTHFSVVDSRGMAVSNTTTLEGSWGARIVVRGAGFVLNNEMGDFNWFPEHTDRAGRIGTTANRIRPGKRMLSSQSPTIVARDGHPVLVTGSPGGRTIINTALQMVLAVVEFGEDLPTAMRAPRIHHQWLPDRLIIETHSDRLSPDAVKTLQSMGHRVSRRSRRSYQGDAHSIAIDPDSGRLHGVADWRRNGLAAGF
ncbi:MAG: gamma-glutamyltransferase [Planctomycetota bacterium]|nr:gamma-glutamyltransferase [Planctomycetota bacterium]